MWHCSKGCCANIRRRSEAKHCSSLCSQSEGDEYRGEQARAEYPIKSCPQALAMFDTCSWPSLCEQSELQCCASILRYANSCDFFIVYFSGNSKVLCNIALAKLEGNSENILNIQRINKQRFLRVSLPLTITNPLRSLNLYDLQTFIPIAP